MGRTYVYASSSESESETSSIRHSCRPRDREGGTLSPKYRHSPPLPGSQTLATPPRPEAKSNSKRPTPQQNVDKMWEQFSQKKFSSVLKILPSSPVPPPTLSDGANELLSAGYERAAEECRRKVRKIIVECKRRNTRYRDAGWDLDWDLNFERGNCLNTLDTIAFDVSKKALKSTDLNAPKAVKRVHEIFEKPTFLENVLPGDIKQGRLGDCWFVASLTGLTNVKGGVQRSCVEYDTRIGIYGFVFFRDGEWIYSIIDDKLYLKSPWWDSPSKQRDLLEQVDREDVERVYRKTYQTGSKALFFASNVDQNETWVPLIEKAYAKAHGDYQSLHGGWLGEALEDLSGGVTTQLLASDIFDLDAFWDNEISKVNEEFLFGLATGLFDGGTGTRDGIREGHAYVIMEARTLKNGTRLVKVRNPWGAVKSGIWEGPWSDGSKEWTPEIQRELNHSFGGDATFWISYEDLLRKFQNLDRTRLFREPDWRLSQQWIGVEVPWTHQYHEKFRIKLTTNSPLILVLSQLDGRYFKGLKGQYRFRLHFRLHEQDSLGAEDYIVRSHGNYHMRRSVTIELPNMPAGNYVVFVTVVGERYIGEKSVEDVVERECTPRVHNEKLAQVGLAYDLAHSKAAAHLEQLEKARRKAEWAKASEARMKERRKQWETRCIRRDAAKKQAKKNSRKAKRAAEKLALKAKRAEEKSAARKARKKMEAGAESGKGELKTEDKGAQTEDCSEDVQGKGSVTEPVETDTVSTNSSSTPQDTPHNSPRSEKATLVDDGKDKVDVPPAVDDVAVPPHSIPSAEKDKRVESNDGSDPNATSLSSYGHEDASTPQEEQEKQQVDPVVDDDADSDTYSVTEFSSSDSDSDSDSDAGNSSDSPVEDWENEYDSDDVTETPRVGDAPVASPGPHTPTPQVTNTIATAEEVYANAAWNAIAVIGLRVYSKDENLELRVVMEGGDLEERGMGIRGEMDLDNAQTNAGGQRKKTKSKKERRRVVI